MYQLVLAYLIFGGDFDLNNFNKISSFNYIFYSQNLNSRFNLSLKNLSSLQLIRTNVMLVIVILVFFFFFSKWGADGEPRLICATLNIYIKRSKHKKRRSSKVLTQERGGGGGNFVIF
jgi:hypothetical protein